MIDILLFVYYNAVLQKGEIGMQKFVMFEKRSKKEQRRINAEKRGTWHGFNPVSRTIPSGKTYNRKKATAAMRKQSRIERDCYYFA